jgi:hypothetical protein
VRREVWVDYGAAGLGAGLGGEWVSYDLEEITRAIPAYALKAESELSIAVRTIVSEVGADRLLANRYGLIEAIGILYTLDNRLDSIAYNPDARDDAPVFPGCGVEGTLASCANAEQYGGNGTWRALAPRARYAPAVLDAAVEVAVTAWWLQDSGLVADFTQGATNYVHRCGGSAYGLTTHHCDAHLGRPERDVPGAEAHTGPLVFRAPAHWLRERGYYALHESVRIHYDPWWGPPAAGSEEHLVIAPPRFVPDGALAAGRELARVAAVQGPVEDPDALAVLTASWLR